MIISAGRNEIFDFALPMGVGLVDMSINLTKFLCENRQSLPSEIIFVGSAGLYKEGKILKIYESRSAANCEISALYELSYSPISYEIIARNSTNVSYETIINSSNFITTDKKSALKFFERGYFLENMKVAKKLDESLEEAEYPIMIKSNFAVDVELVSTLRVSPESFQIRWWEIVYDENGRRSEYVENLYN